MTLNAIESFTFSTLAWLGAFIFLYFNHLNFRRFASLKRNGWVVRKARALCGFRGTYRYCSPNIHADRDQGRMDDIWSLMYMLIEMHCGLPWQKEGSKLKIAYLKQNLTDKELMQSFPGMCFVPLFTSEIF